MSYSLKAKCRLCQQEPVCLDRHFIEGAINGIHQVWPASKGHFGSGSIILDCQNYKEVDCESREQIEFYEGIDRKNR